MLKAANKVYKDIVTATSQPSPPIRTANTYVLEAVGSALEQQHLFL